MAARHSYSAEEGASTTGEDHEAFNSLDTRSRIRKKKEREGRKEEAAATVGATAVGAGSGKATTADPWAEAKIGGAPDKGKGKGKVTDAGQVDWCSGDDYYEEIILRHHNMGSSVWHRRQWRKGGCCA